MSIAAISSSSNYSPTQNVNQFQQFKQDLSRLGQEIESGNLSGAQEAFANLPKPGQSQGNNPIDQAIKQLGQDLQAGNLSAAAQDFKGLHQDLAQRFGGSAQPVGPTAEVPSALSSSNGLSVNA